MKYVLISLACTLILFLGVVCGFMIKKGDRSKILLIKAAVPSDGKTQGVIMSSRNNYVIYSTMQIHGFETEYQAEFYCDPDTSLPPGFVNQYEFALKLAPCENAVFWTYLR